MNGEAIHTQGVPAPVNAAEPLSHFVQSQPAMDIDWLTQPVNALMAQSAQEGGSSGDHQPIPHRLELAEIQPSGELRNNPQPAIFQD